LTLQSSDNAICPNNTRSAGFLLSQLSTLSTLSKSTEGLL